VLVHVVSLEALLGLDELRRHVKLGRRGSERPRRSPEDENGEIDREVRRVVRLLHLLLERRVEVPVELHVLEHTLQLRGVLEPARILELADHRRFGVFRGGGVLDETRREHLGVELLEDVLVLDVLEDGHLRKRKKASQFWKSGERVVRSRKGTNRVGKRLLDIRILARLVTLAEEAVGVLGEKFGRLVRRRARLVAVNELAASLQTRWRQYDPRE
jgi:hypothetical protein